MEIKAPKDFATGLLFLAIGIAAYHIATTYNMGTLQKPGSGVLPRILAVGLILSGVLLAVQSTLAEGPQIEAWSWRPLIMTTVATIVFAALIDREGLVLTMILSMTLVALGTHETRWGEFAIFMVLMISLGLGIFIYGLGMPIKVMPWS